MTLTPQLLHDWYRMNVMDLRPHQEWDRRWVHFIREGYTLDDLALLVKYLRREIKAERRNPGSLKLSNILEWGADVSFLRLDEDLAMAKAAYPSAPPPPPPPPRPSAPVASQEELAGFARRLREKAAQLGVNMRPDSGERRAS